MPENVDQRSRPAQGYPRGITAHTHDERAYSNRANSESSEASYYHHSGRSQGGTANRAEPSNSATTQSYYAMQRWAEETPKEQPWNGLKYTVSSNKDEIERK